MAITLNEKEFTDRVQKIVLAVAGLGIRDVLQVMSASTLILARIIGEEGRCPCGAERCIFTGDMVTIIEKYVEQHLLPDLEKVVKGSVSLTYIPPSKKENIH